MTNPNNPKESSSLCKRTQSKIIRKLSIKASKSEKQGLITEFFDLKSILMERLLLIKTMQNTIEECNGDTTMLDLNCEEMIHSHMLTAMDEWNEMKNLYNRERSKRIFRLSDYYLEVHRVLLLRIRDHIHELNDIDLTAIPNDLSIDDKNVPNENLETSQKISKYHSFKHKISPCKENENVKQMKEQIKRMEDEISSLKSIIVEKQKVIDDKSKIITNCDDYDKNVIQVPHPQLSLKDIFHNITSSLSDELQKKEYSKFA